ncbi:hypothetical protein KIN20_015614 [Parelaphostrongylus tenuis]|uniref:Uncharacterized protein n=1 Tax=Parelaphostrongylus tenuis TaxID=148309 RepID=A0AAD5MIS1_PARTN|nr:hypothetical protein KIN20_015614 [Parelaphostrongylus tenuis]
MEYVLISAQLVKADRFKYPEHRSYVKNGTPHIALDAISSITLNNFPVLMLQGDFLHFIQFQPSPNHFDETICCQLWLPSLHERSGWTSFFTNHITESKFTKYGDFIF